MVNGTPSPITMATASRVEYHIVVNLAQWNQQGILQRGILEEQLLKILDIPKQPNVEKKEGKDSMSVGITVKFTVTASITAIIRPAPSERNWTIGMKSRPIKQSKKSFIPMLLLFRSVLYC
mmetsp:Transcript_17766/g.17603  ORF Transcript_17766/g.17603 Transcript_17766/m.17603 type:complete len:121 (+) Transcript_17766:103-465(+)